MAIDLKGYRVFIATPGGLDAERKSFRQVISEYNDSDALRRGVMFLPVGWEATLGGVGRPQALINKDLRECDYLVLVLWDRWGSPPSTAPDGGYTSGTEEEYGEALDCLIDPDCPMRQIIVFFRAVDERKLSDPGEQLKKVLVFKEKLEKEKSLLFYTYDVIPAYESKLRSHLAQWVRDHEAGLTAKTTPPELSLPTPEVSVGKVEDGSTELLSLPANEQHGESLVRAAKELAFESRFTEAETLFARAVALNNDLGALLHYGNFLVQRERLAQAKLKFERVVELADETHEAIWKARALNSLGDVYLAQGDMKQAENNYKQSLEILKQLDNKEGMADLYNKLGDLYEAIGNLDQAEAMEHQSLKIYEHLGKKESMADVYGKLGNFYQVREDFDRAEEMHRHSLEIKETLGISEGLADVYSNLGNLYQARGNINQAEKMYSQSLELFERLGDQQGLADIYSTLGDLHQDRGHLDKAEGMYRRSLEIFEELRNKQGAADIYNNLGSVYMARKETEEAESAYRSGLELFEQLGDKQGMADVYSNLSDLYKDCGDTEQAEIMDQKSSELLR